MVLSEFHALVDQAKKEIREITSDDLRKMQRAEEDFVLIDVRDKEDADKG